jgi:hypothetical protein
MPVPGRITNHEVGSGKSPLHDIITPPFIVLRREGEGRDPSLSSRRFEP